jgi:hypothetical protein
MTVVWIAPHRGERTGRAGRSSPVSVPGVRAPRQRLPKTGGVTAVGDDPIRAHKDITLT